MPGKSTGSHLIFLTGSGGVGKTSLAASLAIAGALRGFKVLALTIDPAKRLADTLGVASDESFGHPVPVTVESGKEFHAAMLDYPTAAAELIDYYCPDKSLAESIKSNRIFRTVIHAGAGAEEFIALGQVFRISEDATYDYIIVDTAPTHYALNFFLGPDRLLQFIDPEILEKVLAPLKRFQLKGVLTVQSQIGKILNRIIQSLVGIGLISDLTRLSQDLNLLINDFRTRVHKMHGVLRNPGTTSCIIVTGPDAFELSETHSTIKTLQHAGIALKSVIINQVYPALDPDLESERIQPVISCLTSDYGIDSRLIHRLNQQLRRLSTRGKLEADRISAFCKAIPGDLKVDTVPYIPKELTSLENLQTLHPFLESLIELLLSESG